MSLEALSNVASLQAPAESKTFSCEIPQSNPISVPFTPSRQNSEVPTAPPTLARHKSSDWARSITLEERLFIRDKIKNAYSKKTSTYQDLIDTCCAIEEELVFANAPSRLDYFKSGVQYEKRVAEKLNQVRVGYVAGSSCCAQESTEQIEKPLKRSKTQL